MVDPDTPKALYHLAQGCSVCGATLGNTPSLLTLKGFHQRDVAFISGVATMMQSLQDRAQIGVTQGSARTRNLGLNDETPLA
jgi:hypothetical protein